MFIGLFNVICELLKLHFSTQWELGYLFDGGISLTVTK
jgi:hypothetical protein